ncbi:DUF3883 domain-containing protein [Brevundimonas sp.]|uniref:DUF3883 domain-containing protein n=1 Tax=Brevundimonas sp. TaxID=1871086 RepID=UPI0035AEDA9D
MANAQKTGTDWQDEELDAIVAAYFSMLEGLPNAQRGFKAESKRTLDAKIGRGIGSIDFKLGNLAFVAGELGLPRLPGFAPAPNVQDAIFPAFRRYLESHSEVLADDAFLPHWGWRKDRMRSHDRTAEGGGWGQPQAQLPSGMSEPTRPYDSADPAIRPLTLTETPSAGPPRTPRPEGLTRLVRKYDPAARDHRNRALGLLGEHHVLHHERARLIAADRPDLARRIEWTSQERGDGAGYDIRSFEPSGAERLIEVKATRGGPTTPFWLTRTEREVSMERPADWRLYRLHDLATAPGLFVLPPPLEASVTLEAETWRARL